MIQRSPRIQQRQTLRLEHTPLEVVALARYLRVWGAESSFQAGQAVPPVPRDADLMARLARLGAQPVDQGVALDVGRSGPWDLLALVPVAGTALFVWWSDRLDLLALVLVGFAIAAFLFPSRGQQVLLDANGLRLQTGERLPWSQIRGASVGVDGVLVHTLDGSPHTVHLRHGAAQMADVITDLARPDDGPLPVELEQLGPMRERRRSAE